MPQTLLTVDMVTRAALEIAHEKATFLGTIDRSYDDQFRNKAYKIGDTLRIRNPNQYTRRQGSRIMDVQNQAETAQNLTVAIQDGVDMRFNGAELALSIEEFSERYIEPAVSVMVSGVEGDVLTDVSKGIYQTVGTAGTPPTDLVAVGAARAKLNQSLAPKDGNRAIQCDSVTMGGLVNGLKGLFQDAGQIKQQYREGMIGRTAMADWYENEKTWTMTNIADVTGTADAASLVTDGGTLLDMHTTVVSPNVGQVFTVAGVYDCHPETKAAYSHLKQFVITATSAGGAVSISPPTYLTGAKRNVGSATGAEVTVATFNSATLTFWGSASTGYRQNLMYHKDFATFVTADLPIMAEAESCVRRVKDGLAMRVWKGSDIRNDEMLMRIDILYGWKLLRPEWACRISN